ncbi:hypothetical protein Mapa_003037 [Marchantia paleacea]|nr:hypothetical protein Mapa_003037 [Marchantia paleacea]
MATYRLTTFGAGCQKLQDPQGPFQGTAGLSSRKKFHQGSYPTCFYCPDSVPSCGAKSKQTSQTRLHSLQIVLFLQKLNQCLYYSFQISNGALQIAAASYAFQNHGRIHLGFNLSIL